MAHLDLAELFGSEAPTFNLITGERFTLTQDVSAKLVFEFRSVGKNATPEQMLRLMDSALGSDDDRARFQAAWDAGKVDIKQLVRLLRFVTDEVVKLDPTTPDPIGSSNGSPSTGTPSTAGALPGT